MDAIFEFSTNTVPLIIKEIASAQKYVRIAMFQIHRSEVFDALNDLLAKNIKVEILTLPYDSINEDVKSEVKNRFEQLSKNGAIIYFDKWNVGDPKETRTAFGRWYSFHGKFIVTEKSAIALSANFTISEELDAAIIYRDDQTKIQEFNQQFDRLLELFVTPSKLFDGQIRKMIVDKVKEDAAEKIFELPANVDKIHENHWILHYPVELCSAVSEPCDKLYITPFDCRGRVLLSSIIEKAEKWVYISTESFTDENFSKFLVSLCINKKIKLKIITGAKSRDFTDRLEDMLRNLLAQKIEVRTPTEPIHAKLLITDKAVVVSSINLNKMNLGHFKTLKYWRENTESVLINQDPDLIDLAKAKFEENFERSIDVQDFLCEKLEGLVKDVFSAFKLSPNPEVRALFARFILKKEIETKKKIVSVGRISEKLMAHYGRNRVEKDDLISALLLYYLSESKNGYNQLKEKFDELEENINIKEALNRLVFSNFIEKENEYYKINVNALAF